MIDLFAKTAADIAREMYSAGADGEPLDRAVEVAIDKIPSIPVKPIIARHLRKAFSE